MRNAWVPGGVHPGMRKPFSGAKIRLIPPSRSQMPYWPYPTSAPRRLASPKAGVQKTRPAPIRPGWRAEAQRPPPHRQSDRRTDRRKDRQTHSYIQVTPTRPSSEYLGVQGQTQPHPQPQELLPWSRGKSSQIETVLNSGAFGTRMPQPNCRHLWA